MSHYSNLLSIAEKSGAAYLPLIDPDKIDVKDIPHFMQAAAEAGVDGFLVGGSLVMADSFDQTIAAMKAHTTLPVIIFPGSLHQISAKADAILFLSIISGRNPEHLIGNQVLAAPIIRKMNLEAISTGYMLIESGRTTSAEFMSGTRPIPRAKPDIAVAHALAAEYLGFKFVYLEGGSGAEVSVPEEMIGAIAHYTSIPMITGGGIRTPELAHKKARAGAKVIVTGNVLEENGSQSLLKEFASAIHYKKEIYV